MTEEKNPIILLRKPPHGSMYPVEGLRMGVALSGDLEPTLVVMNDAVFAFLKDSDKSMAQPHIDFLKGIDLDIFVDKKSLIDQQLEKEDLIDQVTIKEHDEILKIIEDGDVVIPF